MVSPGTRTPTTPSGPRPRGGSLTRCRLMTPPSHAKPTVPVTPSHSVAGERLRPAGPVPLWHITPENRLGRAGRCGLAPGERRGPRPAPTAGPGGRSEEVRRSRRGVGPAQVVRVGRHGGDHPGHPGARRPCGRHLLLQPGPRDDEARPLPLVPTPPPAAA